MREAEGASRHRRQRTDPAPGAARAVDYRQLVNPFRPQERFSADRIAAIHDTALQVLEELGIRVLLPEARAVLAAAGALVDEATETVRIGREIVVAALDSAPRSVRIRAGDAARDLHLAEGRLAFGPGAGSPNCTDLVEGRRPGRLRDFENFTRLCQHFDAIHFLAPCVEPQDVPDAVRHIAMTRAQMTLSDKAPFIYSRGPEQVADAMEMIRLARGLDDAAFRAEPWCYTIINTNSPRVLDRAMAQGIMDFAAAGQASVITPFCLAGAMAPITVAGALTLQHAEALTGIALAQLVRPGAPVIYGSFASSVDMRSGAPAFGTPEHVATALGAGQLARLVGLPWRSGGGTSAPVADAQAANETQTALWGNLLAGANMQVHAAGWMEGGLVTSFEKFITDLEVLQSVAELCTGTADDAAAIGFDAIAEVAPGGHFFAATHTMERYRTAFYTPLVADWSNHGQWLEAGGLDATARATAVWQRAVEHFTAPPPAPGIEAMEAFAARREAEGGAAPSA